MQINKLARKMYNSSLSSRRTDHDYQNNSAIEQTIVYTVICIHHIALAPYNKTVNYIVFISITLSSSTSTAGCLQFLRLRLLLLHIHIILFYFF
jgi:hypothetical protein